MTNLFLVTFVESFEHGGLEHKAGRLRRGTEPAVNGDRFASTSQSRAHKQAVILQEPLFPESGLELETKRA
jgi:hypothetical protein